MDEIMTQYLDPPRGTSTLSRGGTRCNCGAEKDRWAIGCKAHRTPTPVVAKAKARRQDFLAHNEMLGWTVRELADYHGITRTRVWWMLAQARKERNDETV